MRYSPIGFKKENPSICIYKGNTLSVYAVCNLLSLLLLARTTEKTPFSYVLNSQKWLCTMLNAMQSGQVLIMLPLESGHSEANKCVKRKENLAPG